MEGGQDAPHSSSCLGLLVTLDQCPSILGRRDESMLFILLNVTRIELTVVDREILYPLVYNLKLRPLVLVVPLLVIMPALDFSYQWGISFFCCLLLVSLHKSYTVAISLAILTIVPCWHLVVVQEAHRIHDRLWEVVEALCHGVVC